MDGIRQKQPQKSKVLPKKHCEWMESSRNSPKGPKYCQESAVSGWNQAETAQKVQSIAREALQVDGIKQKQPKRSKVLPGKRCKWMESGRNSPKGPKYCQGSAVSGWNQAETAQKVQSIAREALQVDGIKQKQPQRSKVLPEKSFKWIYLKKSQYHHLNFNNSHREEIWNLR